MDKIEHIRDEYRFEGLNKKNISSNPVKQFEVWFNEALSADIPYPNAMVLSTCGTSMQPTSRMVLLKGFNEEGFVLGQAWKAGKG